MPDVLRPYHHVAPVAGTMTVFCGLEYPRDAPPDAIEVDGVRWVRVDADDRRTHDHHGT